MQFFTIVLALAASAIATPVALEERQTTCRKLTCTVDGTLLRTNQFDEWKRLIDNQGNNRAGTGGWKYTQEPKCVDLKCSAAFEVANSPRNDLPYSGSTYSAGYAVMNYKCDTAPAAC